MTGIRGEGSPLAWLSTLVAAPARDPVKIELDSAATVIVSVTAGEVREWRDVEGMRPALSFTEAMRAEWGNDEGVSSAARHREKLVGWLSRTRAALDASKKHPVRLVFGPARLMTSLDMKGFSLSALPLREPELEKALALPDVSVIG